MVYYVSCEIFSIAMAMAKRLVFQNLALAKRPTEILPGSYIIISVCCMKNDSECDIELPSSET